MSREAQVRFCERRGLCPEFRRTQGSVTGSCGVFMRYGRIRPLGSCGRRADAVVLPRDRVPPGSFLPPPPDDPLPEGQVKGTLRVSLRDRCATPDMPSARRTGSYRGQGGKRGRRCRLRARDCMGSPGLQDSQFRR